MRILELGAGNNPSADMVHHDRVRHAPHIDVAWDLDVVPWPWDDEEWFGVWAMDVMEHLKLDVAEWLDECWRILEPHGKLHLRLPAFDNPDSFRDPTHRRVFHPETFDYWDPETELWQEFGSYYFADSDRWWIVEGVWRQDDIISGDFRFDLRKIT